MLAKSKRLTTRNINDILSKGKVFQSPLFLMRTLFGQKDTRISAVAPVKIAKKAVVRNRNRRIIYNLLLPLFNSVRLGTWAVIFAKKDLSDMEKDIVKNDLSTLLRSISN